MTPPRKALKRPAETPIKKTRLKKQKQQHNHKSMGKEKQKLATLQYPNHQASKPAKSGQPSLHAFLGIGSTLRDQRNAVILSDEQQGVLKQIALKKNVFLTGAAGR